MAHQGQELPLIDISPLVQGAAGETEVAEQFGRACREHGFFCIRGHHVDPKLQSRLEVLSRDFFARDLSTKRQIRMALGGRAWRGYFALGDELTSGQPDQKEGIYFGKELSEDDPRVLAQTPLHGRNLFPDPPEFREVVLRYMQAMTDLGHVLMRGVALSLQLDGDFFRNRYTDDPTILFRIFHYPPLANREADSSWSVGEHTDYGLLTILRQDQTGGLQVKSKGEWIEATPIPNTFVCNIGDILERMTGGLYRSTPHRVRNGSGRSRYSFPIFFDPNWNAEIRPVVSSPVAANTIHERWDGADLESISGSYGDYLLSKVAKVFPELSEGL